MKNKVLEFLKNEKRETENHINEILELMSDSVKMKEKKVKKVRLNEELNISNNILYACITLINLFENLDDNIDVSKFIQKIYKSRDNTQKEFFGKWVNANTKIRKNNNVNWYKKETKILKCIMNFNDGIGIILMSMCEKFNIDFWVENNNEK